MKAAIWHTPTLTRVMALVAWLSLSTAVACTIYPSSVGAIFALLAGVTVLLTARARLAAGVIAAFGLAMLFAALTVTLEVVRVHPGSALAEPRVLLTSIALRDPGRWLLSGIGGLMVLATLVPAVWMSEALSGTPVFDMTVRRKPANTEKRVRVVGRPAGRRRMEIELARASRDLRDVSFALMGVDGVGQTAAAHVMQRLDELVLASLTPSDTLSEYGLSERLVVLPGVSAAALVTGVGHLCAAAEQRLGRGVRAAVATFPHDGSTVGYLLDDLEQSLAACRNRDATLGAGRNGSVGVSLVTLTSGR